ncbi:ATP-grasp domain-containing protein [Streptomyces sp. NBC_00525]|uniref:ATP-grasp domain-containing protein n=1 Tax=Streptomyces sp. NBC_00525 TaxID=2903660 RepID=UPI002E81EA3D|nr:ATP-grasp domain-containing protein [Streptomyces sp. NBC_00525]WUC97273.1 ATP-grasp domain-containing protein [Streptomyces sp. NBC_00525]
MAATSRAQPCTSEAPALLLMGSGDRRYREYFVAAVSRHFRLWLLDAYEPSWQLAYVEGTSVLDTQDLDALLAEAQQVVRRLPVAGVFTNDESLVHVAARLAEALGLPGSAPDAVLACRDKATTRARLTAAGVPQPACTPVSTAAEARCAADATGYPVVVKARGLAGSLGVVRADHGDAVEAAFEAAGSADWAGVPRYEADVLVEEYLTGPEISVDAIVVDGVCTPMIVARKQTGMDPYFEETGHTVDAADPLLRDAELLGQLHHIHKALGFERGATHTEFKLTPEGPRLVEINARLGGDFIPFIGMLATGTDPAVAAARVAAGLIPDTAPKTQRIAAVRFLYPEADCEVVETTVRTDLFGPTVHSAVATAGPGTRLALPPHGYMNRYGYVVAVGEEAAQVLTDVEAAPALVELRSRPLTD